MPAVPGGNPGPLGFVAITSSETPERITKNFANSHLAGILPGVEQVRAIIVKVPATMTGIIYIGRSNMDITAATKTGVLFELLPGESFPIGSPDGPPQYNLHDFWMDVSENGEGAYVFYHG